MTSIRRNGNMSGPRLVHHASSRSVQSSTQITSPLLRTHKSNESNHVLAEVEMVLSSQSAAIGNGGVLDDQKKTCFTLMARWERMASDSSLNFTS